MSSSPVAQVSKRAPAKDEPSSIETGARRLFAEVLQYLKAAGARFVRGDESGLEIAVGVTRIPLNLRADNYELASLFLSATGCGTLSASARSAVQRLMVRAGSMPLTRERRFAVSLPDGIHVAVAADKKLVVGETINVAENGAGGVWVSRPVPFSYQPTCDPAAALRLFEDLLVSTLACPPDLRWLVAMHAGLAPYLRDVLPARFLLWLTGESQTGKTSGIQRFSLLHGLGPVKGDYSVAALGNMPDSGLLLLDNVEQADLSQALTNHLLFLSTGAERGRSDVHGRIRISQGEERPIAVITSIEGPAKDELVRRSVEVPFSVAPGAHIARGPIERAITEHRDTMLSGLMRVLLESRRRGGRPALAYPCPVDEFSEHFSLLCCCIESFAEIAGKPRGWAAGVIDVWVSVLKVGRETSDDPLETLVAASITDRSYGAEAVPYTHEGIAGTLWVTESAVLLNSLRRSARDMSWRLPVTATGLTRRLQSTAFRTIAFLDEASGVAKLRRQSRRRPIGIWTPNAPSEHAHLMEYPPIPASLRLVPVELHQHLRPDDECLYIWDYLSASWQTRGDVVSRFIHCLKQNRSDGKSDESKRLAICYAANALGQLVTDRNAVYVPIPPSVPMGEPGYDDRLVRVLESAGLGEVRSLLRTVRRLPSLNKTIPLDERIECIEIDEECAAFEPSHLVVVDDVLTTGAHYRAAVAVLSRRFPFAVITGLFLSRTLPQLARRMQAGGAC